MPIHWAWVIYSLIPRPFLVGGVRKGRGRKGLVNYLTPTWIRPAFHRLQYCRARGEPSLVPRPHPLTAGMQPWIRVRIKLFTRPFLPLPFSPRPLGRVWEPNYVWLGLGLGCHMHARRSPRAYRSCSQIERIESPFGYKASTHLAICESTRHLTPIGGFSSHFRSSVSVLWFPHFSGFHLPQMNAEVFS